MSVYITRGADVAQFAAEIQNSVVELILEHEAGNSVREIRDFRQLVQKSIEKIVSIFLLTFLKN